MFTLISHGVYAALAFYGLKAFESYQAQVILLVPKKTAARRALLWPKYLLK